MSNIEELKAFAEKQGMTLEDMAECAPSHVTGDVCTKALYVAKLQGYTDSPIKINTSLQYLERTGVVLVTEDATAGYEALCALTKDISTDIPISVISLCEIDNLNVLQTLDMSKQIVVYVIDIGEVAYKFAKHIMQAGEVDCMESYLFQQYSFEDVLLSYDRIDRITEPNEYIAENLDYTHKNKEWTIPTADKTVEQLLEDYSNTCYANTRLSVRHGKHLAKCWIKKDSCSYCELQSICYPCNLMHTRYKHLTDFLSNNRKPSRYVRRLNECLM